MTPHSAQHHQKPSNVGTPEWLDGEVHRYISSGDYDGMFAGWPGDNFIDVAQTATQRLRTALVEETLRRADGFGGQVMVPDDLHAWSRIKLSPMVEGLFPADERAIILDLLARNVVFLTPQNIVSILTGKIWLSTAWKLGNMYLASLGAPVLSQEGDHIVGLSEEAACYVSMSYFEEADPFADFVVHEAHTSFTIASGRPSG